MKLACECEECAGQSESDGCMQIIALLLLSLFFGVCAAGIGTYIVTSIGGGG